ncbi:hypothetical protein KQX54_011198, partial [Cotesia glomerata]
MKKKKILQASVFFDHDLTPRESLIANKLRLEAKKLKGEVKGLSISNALTKSDHFPVVVTLHSTQPIAIAQLSNVMCSAPPSFSLRWCPSSAHSYKNSMFVSPLIAQNFATAITNDLNHALQKAIMNAARDAGMLKLLNSQPKSRNRYISKPWHDDECRAKKKQTKTLLYHCKLEGQPSILWQHYHHSKKEYFNLIKHKAEKFQEKLTWNFNNARSPKDFWSAINSVKGYSTRKNEIPLNTWYDYFSSLFTPRKESSISLPLDYHESLDQEFTMGELCNSVKK